MLVMPILQEPLPVPRKRSSSGQGREGREEGEGRESRKSREARGVRGGRADTSRGKGMVDRALRDRN